MCDARLLIAIVIVACGADDGAPAATADTGDSSSGAASSSAGSDADTSVDATGEPTGGVVACPSDRPPIGSSLGDDLSCMGAPAGTTECAAITLSGTITAVLGGPRPGSVEVFDATGNLLASTTTPDGYFELALPVGPEGFTGRVLANAQGYWPHDVFEQSQPFFADELMDLGMVNDELVDAQFALTMSGIADSTKGLVIVRTYDCVGNKLTGVTADIDVPYERRLYTAENSLPDPDLTETSSHAGVVFTNVEPGHITATMTVVDPAGRRDQVLGIGEGEASAGVFTGIFVHPQ